MYSYRSFRNFDPPALRRLWHGCGLGRGAAIPFDADTFEQFVFCQPYFDPEGVIIAEHEGEVIGYLHAGFGPDVEGRALDPTVGTLCVVMVDPEHRRRGVGRELVRRGEEYLRNRGATQILAGSAAPHDPFYVGIYGGLQPAGFLMSDPAAAPFFESLGYVSHERKIVYQREISSRGSPGGLRLMNIRRTTQLVACEPFEPRTWWWSTRLGRLDCLHMGLVAKADQRPLAAITIVGLDSYVSRWRQRTIGVSGLQVAEDQRRKGYGQALLVEVCRRVRDEAITLVEAHVSAADAAGKGVLESVGFQPVDEGTVFIKPGT